MEEAFRYSVDEEKIGTILFDLPGSKVNTLSIPVLDELEELLQKIEKEGLPKVLLIRSAKKGNFVAGADIKEFLKILSHSEALQMAEKGQKVFRHLEIFGCPTVAVIEGGAMGGGTELALGCQWRIAVDIPKTKISLPETQLGLVPGWGGTQRLPRLLGLEKGLFYVMTGKAMDARRAYKLGAADKVIAKPFLEEELKAFCSAITDRSSAKKLKQRRGVSGIRALLVERNPLGRRLLFWQAEREALKKSKGHYPAPVAALHVIRDTYGLPIEEGMRVEAGAIANLVENRVTQSLIQLFFANQAVKKNPGPGSDGPIRPIKRASVLGAGVMGGGIAWFLSKGNIPVRMKDLGWSQLATGLKEARSYYNQLVKRRKIKPSEVRRQMHLISPCIDDVGVETADLVIEAVVEDMKVKKVVLEEVEESIQDDAILASNTSSLSITEMASALKRPHNFVGIHFFNPVNRMPLVEIIPGEKTSDGTIATAVALVKKLGKTPMVVKDCPGFLVNRILLPYLNEAGWMLQEGADVLLVDQTMRRFGMPMGPFELLDAIGLDVGAKAAHTLEEAFGKRAETPEIFQNLVGRGFVGSKGGKGIYLDAKKGKLNPGFVSLIGKRSPPEQQLAKPDMIDRLVLGMVNEAARCLDEGVVPSAQHVDMAMILGIGFPPFRGGLLRWADTRGSAELVESLQHLQRYCAERFEPAALLQEMATLGHSFYGDWTQDRLDSTNELQKV